MEKRSELKIEKVTEDDVDADVFDNKETSTWGDNFDLKKIAVEVHSQEEAELNKDFTLSNLNDNLFNSRIINYIIGRINLLKLVEMIMPYANSKVTKDMSEKEKQRVLIERIEYRKIRKIVLSEVRVILVMSRARNGAILEAFLKGEISDERMKEINEAGELENKPKRSFMDKLLGRNR